MVGELSVGEDDILFAVAEVLAEHGPCAVEEVRLETALTSAVPNGGARAVALRAVCGRFRLRAEEMPDFGSVGHLVAWIQGRVA